MPDRIDIDTGTTHLLCSIREEVAVLTLNRPEARNALSPELSAAFLEQVEGLLDVLLPAFEAEGKAYLTLAFGCTGGRHRSVAVSEEVARRLRERGLAPGVVHRDIAKGG